MRVDSVAVAARRVRLPDLDELAAERLAVAVQHATLDDDPLTGRLALVLPRQIGVRGFDRRLAEGGPRQLRLGRGKDYQGLLRRPKACAHVVVMVVRRVDAAASDVVDLGKAALTDAHGSPPARRRRRRR